MSYQPNFRCKTNVFSIGFVFLMFLPYPITCRRSRDFEDSNGLSPDTYILKSALVNSNRSTCSSKSCG